MITDTNRVKDYIRSRRAEIKSLTEETESYDWVLTRLDEISIFEHFICQLERIETLERKVKSLKTNPTIEAAP